jgi:hypothetical protein
MTTTSHYTPTQQTITSIKQMLLLMEQHLDERERMVGSQHKRAQRHHNEMLAEMRAMIQTIHERLDTREGISAMLPQAVAVLHAMIVEIPATAHTI